MAHFIWKNISKIHDILKFKLLVILFGNVVHVGERDCSMQRRHQKLIEESPAIALDEKTRARLVDVTVKATKFIGYENAGTF